MTRRVLRPALALLVLGLLTGTVLGVSAGFASRKDDIPTLQKKLADCRQDVAYDREAIDYAEKLYALAKKHKVVVFTNIGGPFIMTFAEVRDFLILQYVTGKINKVALASRLHSLALTAAKTLKLLAAAIEQARDERDADQNRCAKLAQQLQQAQGGGGGGGGGGTSKTLTLQPVKATDVSNTHQSELTIDASGRSAHFDASSGADWQADYSWKIPQTITAGNTYTITLHDKILNVTPSQPLGDQMNALAPDFAQAIQAHWPDNPDVEKTFNVPLTASDAGVSDYRITIGFISSSVTYHYK
jgi:hypothetical protein